MKWHYNILQNFNQKYYHGIISYPMLREEVVLKQKNYWLFDFKKQKFLIDNKLIKELPIRVDEEKEFPFRNKLYHTVTEYSSVKIKPEKTLTFRQIVDAIEFQHSNPKHFTLFKIIAVGSDVGRINSRISSNAAFGKDSIFNILGFLRNDVSVVNPRTAPAVEFRLLNKVLVLNELSNLETAQRNLLQEILLLIGDLKNLYEKSSRATNDTRDEYDISNLSLSICYNNLDYYRAIGKESLFFDNVFTNAVIDRFIPFKFDGVLDMEQFDMKLTREEIEREAKENSPLYISMIRSMEWYKQNYFNEIREKPWILEIQNTKLRGRHILLFNKICDFIKLYAESKEEFADLVEELYKCYKAYYDMVRIDGDLSASAFDRYELSDVKVKEPQQIVEEERVLNDKTKTSES